MPACSATTRGDRRAGAEVGAGRQARSGRRSRRRRRGRRAGRLRQRSGRARATRSAADAGGHERRWLHPGAGSAVRRGTRARDGRRRHLGGGSAARAAVGARDLRRQHPGACQAIGDCARHGHFGSEVGGRSWAARHNTDATADAAGRPEHAHRDGSGGSRSQRSFASEAGTGGAARWPFAAGASRPVRGQRAAAAPGAPIPLHSGSGAARGVAPRRRLLQLRRSAQRARCGSRFLLELDHIVPFALGGAAQPSNLRLHCSAHHRFRHRQHGSPPDGAT